MTQQTINIGTTANDGTGDPARTAFDKCNDNFTELYARNRPNAPVAVLMGDSTIAGGNYTVNGAGSILSGSGTTVTVTVANHSLAIGCPVFIAGAADDRFNGSFTVATRASTSVFTYTTTDNFGAGPVTDSAATITVLNDNRPIDRNALHVANALSGNPIGRVYNRAASGTTTTYQLSRLTDDVLGLNPSVVLWGASTNDARADMTAAQSIANLKSGVDTMVAAGITVILHTGTPFDSGATGYSTARLDVHTEVQAWVRDYAAKTAGVVLFDMHAVMSDGTNATGNFRSGYNVADKIHPSPQGQQRAASCTVPANRDLKTIISSLFVPTTKLGVMCIRDDVWVTSAAKQLCANPLFQGTTGTILGTVSGTSATNWIVTNGSGPAVAASLAARADGFGQDLVLTNGASGTGTIDVLNYTFHTKVSAGDILQLSGNVYGSSLTGIGYIRLYVTATVDGVTYDIEALGPSSLTPYWQDDFNGVFYSPKFVVPSGSITDMKARLAISVTATSSAIIGLGCVACRKMSA